MKLTLIRHGITQGNKYNIYYGRTDLPLLPEGVAELEARRARGGYPTAPHYYATPLRRTQQTLAILYGDVPYDVVEDLQEMNFGRFEMKTDEELRHDPAYQAWQGGPATTPWPEGESLADVHKRAQAAVDRLVARGEDAVCITHGGVIATLLIHWFPGWDFGRYIPHPGTGWQVTLEAGKPVSFCPVPFEQA